MTALRRSGFCGRGPPHTTAAASTLLLLLSELVADAQGAGAAAAAAVEGAAAVSASECAAELAAKGEAGTVCECPGDGVDVCDYNCTVESGGKIITNGCKNGTVTEDCTKFCPVIQPSGGSGGGEGKDGAGAAAADAHLMDNVKPATCGNVDPCGQCQPGCQTGYYWHGPPLQCTADSNWTGNGECRYLGVHRVGVGIYALNVGDIKLQDGSFHIDFMMTVRTEEHAFETREDALATFGGGPRDCSPWRNNTARTGGPGAPLGTGSLNTQAREPNTAPFLSPTQYVLARQQNGLTTASIVTVANLGMSFLTLSNPTVTQVTFQSGDPSVSPISYRVQGTGYFRPSLRNWPFDTQKLEVMLEDLDLTISADKVSFVFCSLGNYTGLSPTVRFPDHQKQLSTGVEITEMCWPPFETPYGSYRKTHGGAAGSFGVSQASAAVETCDAHGGEYQSSRFTFFIEYKSPSYQRFTKAFLPIVMINFILAMSYVLPVTDYSQRVTMCVGTLTALVLFHVSLETQLPSSETITLADWLLIYSYAMNLATWAVTILLMLMHHAGGQRTNKLAEPFQRVLRCCGPTVILLVTTVLCTLDADDYETGGDAGGKLLGTVLGAIALGFLIHMLEQAVIGRCCAGGGKWRRGAAAGRRRKHPTEAIQMDTFASSGSAGDLRSRWHYEADNDEDDDDEEAAKGLLIKGRHAD